MLVVVFTYSGISTVAMATSEVVDPKEDIPKATIIKESVNMSIIANNYNVLYVFYKVNLIR